MDAESGLLQFYRLRGRDHRGRSLADIRALDAERLEDTHDFIQWLFPLPEPSGANPHAPRLTQGDIAAFGAGNALREELLRSLEVMLRFYGLSLAGTPGARRVERAPDYAGRSEAWLHRSHNFLRISRILRSLALLGCAEEARAFLVQLEEIYRENAQDIGSDTLRYWRGAIEVR
jgi:Opioid growth factor receptor (OGFr) conserved region